MHYLRLGIILVSTFFYLPHTFSFCGTGEYKNDKEDCKSCHISCLQCYGPNMFDCIICNNSLKKCKISGNNIFQCLEKCPEDTISPTVFIQSTTNLEIGETDNGNIQSIVIWLITAALLLLSCLIIIWWCIYKGWKKRIKTAPEAQTLITHGIELQQVILDSELPMEGISPQNLLWDQRIRLGGGQYGDVYRDAFHEREHMARLKHPHIIGLIATMINENIILITPLRQSNLKDFIHTTTGLTITHKIRYCQQISNGMSYLMFKRIVHCDLKASNILVVNENWIEIGDFGLAKRMGNQKKGTMGTITHTAIELFKAKGVKAEDVINDENTEVWSFGVVIWEIFDTTKKLPYKLEVPALTEILILDFLKQNGVLSTKNWPNGISQTLSTLMYKCWNRNPKLRPSFKSLWILFSSMLPESLDAFDIRLERNESNESSLFGHSFNPVSTTFHSFMTPGH